MGAPFLRHRVDRSVLLAQYFCSNIPNL